jgi:hypothetical protein
VVSVADLCGLDRVLKFSKFYIQDACQKLATTARIFLPVILMLAFLAANGLAALAQSNSQLKPATPKLDESTPIPTAPTPAPKRNQAPLHGKIEHSHNMSEPPPFSGGLGHAKGGASDSWFRGRTQDSMLNSSISTGIGIIGVKFVLFTGRSPVINRVFPLTPAAEVGLRPDDVIVAVDGVPTHGLRKEEVYDMIIGTPGTPVTISIERSGNYKAYNLTRMNINELTDPAVRRDYLRSL